MPDIETLFTDLDIALGNTSNLSAIVAENALAYLAQGRRCYEAGVVEKRRSDRHEGPPIRLVPSEPEAQARAQGGQDAGELMPVRGVR